MLLITIPKSAGTSLMKTLGKLHKMPTEQKTWPSDRYQKVPQLRRLYHKHSDCRELYPDVVTMFACAGLLYKQHVPPTTNNLKLLRNIKKVVVLREPESVILSYRRADIKFRKIKDVSESKYLQVARETGLLADLEFFCREWIRNQDSKTLIIHYLDLIYSPQYTINRIEIFWSLPVSMDVKLQKYRYSKGVF